MNFTRAVLLLAIASGAAVSLWRPKWLRTRWTEYWQGESAPVDLAVLRIVTFGCVLWMLPRPEIFLSQPRGLISMPFGWNWIGDHFPITAGWTTTSRMLVLVGSLFGLIGLCSRTAALVAFLGAFYGYGIFQIWGKPTHYHHLVWFLAMLAVAPAGDALSVDAWLARRRSPRSDPCEPTRTHGLPLRFVWLLIGIIYLFPGLWKLWSVGFTWCSADAMRDLIHARWDEIPFFTPLARIDRSDWLLWMGGILVVVFEVGFLFALFLPRLLPWFVAGGVVFHLTNFAILLIFFWAIPIFYLSMVPWGRLWTRLRRRPALVATATSPPPRSGEPSRISTEPPWRRRALLAVGTILVTCNSLAGGLRITSWPFACYPTFAYRASSTKLTLGLEVEFASAPPKVLDLRRYFGVLGADRWDRELHWLALEPNPGAAEKRFRAVWLQVRSLDPELQVPVSRIHFFRWNRSTDPDQRSAPISHRTPCLSLVP